VGGSAVGEEVRDHARDVVRRAGPQGERDERVRGGPGIVVLGEGRLDGLLRDDAEQAVRGEQPPVTGLDLPHRLVELDLALGVPERPQDHVALRVALRLLLREAAGGHEVLDERVVGGDLGELAVAQEVGAGVPDVHHRELRPRAQ
jgi:hypothetical protein